MGAATKFANQRSERNFDITWFELVCQKVQNILLSLFDFCEMWILLSFGCSDILVDPINFVCVKFVRDWFRL
jgi:hypothetical protein